MVLNFFRSVSFRLASDDPTEMQMTAKIIMMLCSIPKNRIVRSLTASEK